ncbi:hypothetical protein [Xanthobacter autotrophicus]|uniref:hypothetical protein n=1 Tax=Xanthobacter autotrophicus TaxID=280 RepID=UPI00372C5E42
MTSLDIEKLRKVHQLMVGGSTPGECAAARSRAEAIAKAAGMTLDMALSKLDAPAQPKPRSFFDGFDDWMEAKEPGWQAEQAAWRAEQVRRRLERQRRGLEEFGSEAAVFAETEHERLLRVTLEPLADRKQFANCSDTYINGYAGWTCRRPPFPLWKAIDAAYPLPRTVTGAWAQFQEWERLMDARHAFNEGYDTPVWVRARQAALSSIMDTYSEPTPDGMRARFAWMDFHIKSESHRDVAEEAATLTALRLDFEMMLVEPAGPEASAPNGSQAASAPQPATRRTNADKRADVLSMLDTHPELSDREIARLAGVSPQTVNTWRKKATRNPETLARSGNT